MNGTKGKKLNYGKSQVDLANIHPGEVKIRISTFIDADVLLKLKKQAKKTGTKYQTLLNSILRKYIENPFSISNETQAFEEVVRKIVREEIKKTGT